MLSVNFTSLSVALVCWLLLFRENMVVTSRVLIYATYEVGVHIKH